MQERYLCQYFYRSQKAMRQTIQYTVHSLRPAYYVLPSALQTPARTSAFPIKETWKTLPSTSVLKFLLTIFHMISNACHEGVIHTSHLIMWCLDMSRMSVAFSSPLLIDMTLIYQVPWKFRLNISRKIIDPVHESRDYLCSWITIEKYILSYTIHRNQK